MKKFLFAILLSFTITLCEPFPKWESEFIVVNNSADTIYCSFYHRDYIDTTFVRRTLYCRPICPMDNLKGCLEHNGPNDSWKSFFADEKIDTLYIVISKILLNDYGRRIYVLNASEVLKVFKVTEKDFDMNQESVTFVYP